MPSIPNPKKEHFEQQETPSPASSPDTVVPEIYRSARSAEVGFGDQLANARNLPPFDAPPPPPLRTMMERHIEETQLEPSTSPCNQDIAKGPLLAHIAPPPQANNGSKTRPRCVGEQGWYMNPYDYNIPSRNKDHKYVSNAQPGFLAGLCANPVGQRPKTISFGQMPPVDTKEQPKKEQVVVETDAEAKPRLVLLGPLRIIRRQCIKSPNLDFILRFIDMYMAEELHSVVERDPIVPGIVYKVSIPMTNENWQIYNQVLARCDRALGVHEMLAVGRDQFDQWSGSTDREVPKDQQRAHNVALQSAVAELNLEELHAALVKEYQDMWVHDGSRYIGAERR
ncbi:hypothetical protein BKA66DRAFT_568121 [Pyrenochaeta sp. MPI-SDFR-AT-0127]|nr:hypothetical protein BKA66DRAFT_568121 [Pyrenochaeta sp. MPI-SDFR-AT-0127]